MTGPGPTGASVANAPVIQLSVGGMTCAGCASTIQRGLAVLPGVNGADVNVATRRATVQADGTLDPDELEALMRAAIEGLGFTVAGRIGADAPAASLDNAPASSAEPGPEHAPQAGLESLAREHEEHRRADAARIADYRRRFAIAAALAIPTVALAMIPALQFEGWEAWSALLASIVVWYSGWPFHRSALKTARHRATTMDTLVSLGSLAAWGWSMWALLSGHGHVYFETAAVIIALIVLGKWFEVRSSAHAGDAIRALSARHSSTVTLADGSVIAREALAVGQLFIVRPGESIATDGVVTDGEAAVDASLVTGESSPVAVSAGAEVIGGTIATDGTLTVEATRVGADTMLAHIARLVDQAQGGKAHVQRLADRIAGIFVPVVLGIAAVTLAAWLLATGDPSRSVQAAVAVLIISCPCALGLATPLAIMVGVGRGAQLGVLIRGPRVIEDTRLVTAVVFDKTGTLTEGHMSVTEWFAPGVEDPQSLFEAAAAVEARSGHPVAAAITEEFTSTSPIKAFRSYPGKGASAIVRGAARAVGLGVDTAPDADAEVTIGSARLFDRLAEGLREWADARESAGETVVFVGGAAPLGDGLLGVMSGPLAVRKPLVAIAAIAVSDTIKVGAAEAVSSLRAAGVEVSLLTGDNEAAARAVATAVGIDSVIAQVLPEDKAAVIETLRAKGLRVAMVGDGVNDAPALAAADIGIAIGTGADVAKEASDLTIVSADVRMVPLAIGLARRTLGVIKGNLVWAFAYNVVAIPLAAAGLLHPMIAAAAMGASSLFVVGNSLRLRSFTNTPAR